MKKSIIFYAGLLVSPYITFADVVDIPGLVNSLIRIINSIIPLIFGLAFLAFCWGVITYLWSPNPEKIKEGRKYMVFSIIGISVMLSVWGLALLVKNSIFPNATTPLDTPISDQNGSYIDEGQACSVDTDCPSGQTCVEGGICQHG